MQEQEPNQGESMQEREKAEALDKLWELSHQLNELDGRAVSSGEKVDAEKSALERESNAIVTSLIEKGFFATEGQVYSALGKLEEEIRRLHNMDL